MSYVSVMPEFMTTAAADLATIGSAIDEANLAAGPSILSIAPAAADEVSVGIAQLFSEHAQNYHAVAREAAAFQENFVQNLVASTGSYAESEYAIVSLLRALDAEVGYYTTAANALTNMIISYPVAVLGFSVFPLFWPLLPLLPFLFLAQISTLFTEVISRQPISYPFVESPLVTLAIYNAIFRAIIFGDDLPASIG